MAMQRTDVNSERWKEVQEMLESLYSAGKVPEVEVNERTIDILHQVAVKLKTEEKICKAQEEFYTALSEEYSAKSKELTEILQAVGLSLEDFPDDCLAATKALATAACILDLKEPTSTNFLLAMNHFAREQLSVSGERTKLSRKQEKLTKKLNFLLEKTSVLERDVNVAKERQKEKTSEETKRKSQTTFITNKTEEYKRKVSELRNAFRASGYDSSIDHSSLVKKHEEIKNLEEKLDGVSLKLESYHDLPPDENLAKLKVEEAKQELRELEREMQKQMGFKSPP